MFDKNQIVVYFFIYLHKKITNPKNQIMKKIYMFMTLLLVSGVIFAQVHKADVGTLQAVRVIKGINTMQQNNTKAVVDSLNYDTDNYDAIGVNGPATFGVYAFFPAATLASHYTAGHSILSEKLFINVVTNLTAIELRIYSDTNTLLYSQPFTPVEGWNNVLLTTPFPIPATGDLFIGYHLTTTAGYPAGCDAGPTNANADWIWLDSWGHLADFGLTYNWNIRAMCGTAPSVPTAGCTPLTWDAGTLELPNTATSGTFTLSNVGTSGPLTCSGISGISAPFTTTLVPGSVSLAAGASATFTFTYTPTVAGTTNQTAVIATNGGNISITLTGTAVTCDAINTFPWTESFESTTWPPACWTIESPDAGTGWAQIASGTTPLPGWTGGTMTTPTGGDNYAAYCTWNTGGATSNDQWLITPQIAVQANQALTYYIFWNGGFQDFVDVKVSTTTNASASFTTTLLTTDTTQFTTSDWTLFTVPLSAYAGQNIYLAFNEHVADNANDGAFIGLDLVKIDAASGISDIKEDLLSIFPNPASDKLYVAATNVKSIEIFNTMGEIVGSFGNVKMINTSDLSIGTYIVKVITDSKVVTQKINIVR